jgi:nicotinamidase-related amidase
MPNASESDGLIRGPLTRSTAHLCIDMQEMFAQDTPWHTPWMKRVLPKVMQIAKAHPQQSIYTRFIPPDDPEDLSGSWRVFYERWRDMTATRIDPAFLELVHPLREIAAMGTVLDKQFFSPFHSTGLADRLNERGVDSLVITGAETDMCVLAAVLDAVDNGFRVVIPVDALCSSSDEMHDALLALYRTRFSCQIETADTDDLLTHWPSS